MKEKQNQYRFIIIAALLVWAVFIFFQYVNQHATYTIFFRVFDSVVPYLLWLIFLAWLSYSLGRTIIVRILKASPEPGAEFPICSALGFLILSFGMTFLTFTHLLSRINVIIFLIIVITISFKDLAGTFKRIRLPRISPASRYEKIVLFLLILFILMNLCFALTPPFGLDEQQYHLNAPLEYINAGGFTNLSYMGGQIQYPQNIEMLYTLTMILHEDILAKLLNFYFGILSLMILIFFCRKFLNRSGIIACGIYYCTWLTYYISSRANIDLAQTFFEGIALLSLILYLEKRKQAEKVWTAQNSRNLRFLFFFSATIMGFCLGIKYSSLLTFNAVIIVILYYHIFFFRSRIRTIIRQVIIYSIVSVAIFSPWIIKNTIIYQNPVAPFQIRRLTSFIKGFAPEPEEQDTPAMPGDLQKKLEQRQVTLNKGVYPESSLKELILMPYNATIHGEWGRQVFDALISPLFLIFLPFVIFISRKPRYIVAVSLYVLVIYLQWMFLQPITRYLAPAMLFMSFLIVFLINNLGRDEDLKIRIPLHFLKILIVFTILMMTCIQVLLFIRKKPYEYIFGTESRYEFLLKNNPAYIQKVIKYVNQNLPPDSRIYLLWEKRGYYLERPYDEDTFGSQFAHLMIRYEDPAKVVEALKEQGFSHILCDMYMPSMWFGSSYKKEQANEQTSMMGKKELLFFRKMAEEHLELLVSSKTIFLYSIK